MHTHSHQALCTWGLLPNSTRARLRLCSLPKPTLTLILSRALLNESHSDVVIDVPLPADESDAEGFRKADGLITRLEDCIRAVLKHS